MIRLSEYSGIQDPSLLLGLKFYTPEEIAQKIQSPGKPFVVHGGFEVGMDSDEKLWIIDNIFKDSGNIAGICITYSPAVRRSRLRLWFSDHNAAIEFVKKIGNRITFSYTVNRLGLKVLESDHSFDIAYDKL
jgi:hypothetical protein